MPYSDINLHIGKRLKMLRTLRGLSQEALARAIGVASQQVQKYEKGANALNATRLYELAIFFNVSVGYFFEGLNDRSPEASLRATPAGSGFGEDHHDFKGEDKNASDRETLELLKSFKRIKDSLLRKRVADLVRALSMKEV